MRREVKMVRRRLLWFTSGFLFTGAAIAYFIHRDLARDRYLLLAQLNDNFDALETRVSNLETVPQDFSIQNMGHFHTRTHNLAVHISQSVTRVENGGEIREFFFWKQTMGPSVSQNGGSSN